MPSLERAKRLECDGLDVAFAFAARPKLRQAAALQTLRAALTRNSIPMVSRRNYIFLNTIAFKKKKFHPRRHTKQHEVEEQAILVSLCVPS